jgi:RNA polymerase sigma-54 factor
MLAMNGMHCGLTLSTKQEQRLSLQTLLLARLLPLSREALHAHLQEAAEGNPLLRVDDPVTPPGSARDARVRRLERGAGPRTVDLDDAAWQRASVRAESLSEHLLAQLGTSGLIGAELRFAALVIGNLDERGWLDLTMPPSPEGVARPDLTLDDLAREAGLDPEDAEAVLDEVMRLDPVGVGARTLTECLLAQADERGFGDLERAVIRDHLPQVERGRLDAVARALGVDVDTVRGAVEEIAALDPRPARAFAQDPAERSLRTPEVAVRVVGGEYVLVDLTVVPCGRLEAPLQYAEDVSARRFLRRCEAEATMLITAIERRNRMVLLVAGEVVRRQRDFFERGPRALRPHTMHEVAQALGVHESTVSRAVADKVIDTPRGLYDLRYFFRAAVPSARGEAVSNEAAREALTRLIAAEDPQRPWSDADLAAQLSAREGVTIARRTVSKYREQLGIAPSSQRVRATPSGRADRAPSRP